MILLADDVGSKRVGSRVGIMTAHGSPPGTREDDSQVEASSHQTASDKASAPSNVRRPPSLDASRATFSKRNDDGDDENDSWLDDQDTSSDDGWDSDDLDYDDDEMPSVSPPDWPLDSMVPSYSTPTFPASPPPLASPPPSPNISQDQPLPVITPTPAATSSTRNRTIRPVIQPPANNVYLQTSLLVGPPDSSASMSMLPVSQPVATLETSFSVPRKGKTPLEPPSPTTTRPLVLLTPIVTDILPSITTGARKEVEVPSPDTYDGPDVPILTVTQSATRTGTPVMSSLPFITAGPDGMNSTLPQVHAGLLPKTERALIAVGSVGATIIVFFVCWLVWKCVKLHKRGNNYDGWRDKMTPALSLDGPKRVMAGLASRVPPLKTKFNKRNWTNLNKPADEAFWEKRLPASPGNAEDARGMRMHAAAERNGQYGVRGTEEAVNGVSQIQVPHHLTVSSRQVQYGTRDGSNRITGVSEMSSLSSGFGDGDIMMAPINRPSAASLTASVTAPSPVAQRSSVSSLFYRRETVYTEASEDALPRFRNINSWVRQQSGRVKRAKQREQTTSDAPPVPNMPPEQDLRLMMPDEEEPRRVETAAKTAEP